MPGQGRTATLLGHEDANSFFRAFHVWEIESAAAKIQVQGERYPERLEKMTGL